MNRKTILSTVALTAAVSAAVFGSIASAQIASKTPTDGVQTPKPAVTNLPAGAVLRVVGTVQSVSQSGLVLNTRRAGEVTVNAGADIWILVEKNGKCAEGLLSDLRSNKPAEVAGTTTGQAATLNARVIVQARCKGLAPRNGQAGLGKELSKHLGAGTIMAINGSTITVTNVAQTREFTVTTTPDTAVLNNGFQAADSLKVGDKIQVLGKADKAAGSTDGRTITAWGIHVESANTRIVAGQVDSVNGNSITLKGKSNRGAVTVALDGSAYRSLSVQDRKLVPASQADIKAGSRVIIEASGSKESNNLAARAVIILPTGAGQKAKP